MYVGNLTSFPDNEKFGGAWEQGYPSKSDKQ